jgi:V/A-type H+-transporting ATPase subunit A
METARIIKKGFLQQNALHPEDTYVNLDKQYKMLKVIDAFYDNALLCVKMDIPISTIRSLDIFQAILKMKYDIPNDKINLLDDLKNKIIKTLSDLRQKYE